MKFVFLILILSSSVAYAKKNHFEIVSVFGSPSCASSELLKAYVDVSIELGNERARAGSEDRIEALELASITLEELLEDSAGTYGMTVVAVFPLEPSFEIPIVTINDQTYPLVVASRNGNQVRLEYTELGICTFANSNYSVGEQEIWTAVQSLLPQ